MSAVISKLLLSYIISLLDYFTIEKYHQALFCLHLGALLGSMISDLSTLNDSGSLVSTLLLTCFTDHKPRPGTTLGFDLKSTLTK